MSRFKSAVLAAVTALASAPAAHGSQGAIQGADADQILEGSREDDDAWDHPLSSEGRGGASAAPSLSARLATARADATDPHAAQWRARIERRLDALSRSMRQAATVSQETDTQPDALSDQLRRIIERTDGLADVGVAVRELSTGAELFSFQGDRELNPASNHKLLTSIAAVELLGADYRFSTDVRLDGDALVLVGDGDPSLQVDDLDALARRVVDSGIDLSRVRRIVADDSAFSSRRFGPGYDRTGPSWSYLAPSGALSLQFNTVTVTVRPSGRGHAPRVSVQPPCPHLVVDNHAVSGRSGHLSIETRAEAGQTIVSVGGSIGRSAVTARRRIADPAGFAASTFAMALAQHSGGTVLAVRRGQASSTARPVAQHHSAPLPEVLSAALVFSNNFTSEQVLRTLGRRLTGQPGDWANGRVALERFWAAIGRDAEALTFENASGYSVDGRLTAKGLVALLALTERPGSPAQALVEILPAAGRNGTMRHRLKGTHGRVRAKTGTLSGASALSGLVVSRDGQRRLGFSILVNGTLTAGSSRRLQDRMVMAMVQHLH